MRLILISLSFSFSSLSSTAKIGLFLFSLLEVSAFYSNFYCRYHHQTTTIKTTNTIINRHDDNDVLSNVIIKSMAITDRISSLLLLNQKGRNVDEINQRKKKKRKCLCPPDDDEEEEENDDDEDELLLSSSLLLLNEDRREVLFAMMGSLWSISGGATGGAAVAAATATATAFNPIQPAFATYGMDAKIELPDVIAGMNERQNKQCLVESLGNRECLVL
jgi:hypothetical protein